MQQGKVAEALPFLERASAAAHRQANRDKLRRYVRRYIMQRDS